MKTSYNEYFIKQCLYFTKQSSERYPEKIQLKLIVGLLELYRGDTGVGLAEVRTFLSLAKNNNHMSEFVNEAYRLLGQFNNKKL